MNSWIRLWRADTAELAERRCKRVDALQKKGDGHEKRWLYDLLHFHDTALSRTVSFAIGTYQDLIKGQVFGLNR